MASLRGSGSERTAPGDTIQAGDTRIKLFLWLNLERTLEKNDVQKRRQLKRVSTLQRAMTKKVASFCRKRIVTPSVAAPGDTNPSDATDASLIFFN